MNEVIQTPEGIHVLKDDTHLSRWIELHKQLGIASGQIDLFKEFIPSGGVVVDAGASLGDHTITYASLVGIHGMVLAFEPNPLAYEALSRNMQSFPWVRTFNVALSNQSGAELMVLMPNAGASFLTKGSEYAAAEGAVMVHTAKLDDYINLMSRCDLIHLDAEGFETHILFGAMETIKRFRPAIVLEVNQECLARIGLDQESVYSTLHSIGYSWRELEACNGPHSAQRDILATPK